MSRSTAVMLATAMSLASASAASAQTIKPRAPTPTGRLPTPAKITAMQEPGGTIRVVWNAVGGATGYTLIRSVPPTGAAPLELPNPADTVYIDRDVRTGSTYYYVVSAINEAGISGMKLGATPVTAARPVAPPHGVRAVIDGGLSRLSWSSPDQSWTFRVERTEVTQPGSERWFTIATHRYCCTTVDNIQSLAPETRLLYRVRSVDSRGNVSDPTVSNEISTPARPAADTTTTNTGADTASADTASADTASDTTTSRAARTNVLPAVVPEPARLRVGGPVLKLGTKSAFTRLRLAKPRWVSLDESIATVNAQGQVRARKRGFTYIVATGVTPDGSIGSLVQRVDVKR